MTHSSDWCPKASCLALGCQIHGLTSKQVLISQGNATIVLADLCGLVDTFAEQHKAMILLWHFLWDRSWQSPGLTPFSAVSSLPVLPHPQTYFCMQWKSADFTYPIKYKWSANYIIFKKSWMFNLFSCCSQICTATFTYFFIFPFFNFFFPSRHHKELTSSGLYSRWRTEFLQQGWTTLSRLNAAECCFWASSPNCNDFVTLTLVLWTNKTRANHMCLTYCLYVIFQNSTGRCTWN